MTLPGLFLALQDAQPGTLPPWAQAALGVFLFLFGAGTLGPWVAGLFRAGTEAQQVDRLKVTFATKHDLNNFRVSLEASVAECSETAAVAQRSSALALQNADTALDQARELRIRQENQGERLVTEVLEPLKEIMREQREMGRTLSAQTALLERLTRQVDGKRGD